jgi:hypothetical protein
MPWFDEECSELLDERKVAKLQWLQNPGQTNGDNLNNVRCETTTIFRNKRGKSEKKKSSCACQILCICQILEKNLGIIGQYVSYFLIMRRPKTQS